MDILWVYDGCLMANVNVDSLSKVIHGIYPPVVKRSLPENLQSVP